jgi:hypothetical protein
MPQRRFGVTLACRSSFTCGKHWLAQDAEMINAVDDTSCDLVESADTVISAGFVDLPKIVVAEDFV